MRAPNRRLKQVMFVAVVLAFACVGIVLWYGADLVAPVNRDIGPPPANMPITEFVLESESRSKIMVWHAAADDATATIVLVHPNGGSRNSMLSRAEFLLKAGYSVMLIDLQGHGESLADSTTMGYLERHDVKAAIKDIGKKNPQHKIAVIGRSLGGAAAVLAAPLDIDALVLESVYPAADQWVQNRVQLRLGKSLSSWLTPLLTWQIKPRLGVSIEELRPIDKIGKMTCPILVLAGSEDQRTTIQETEQLYEAAKEPKQLEVFENAKYQDLYKFAPELYEETVLAFLEKHLKANDRARSN